VLTGTGRFDVIAAADTSRETSLLRTIEQIRALRGVNRVQRWRHLQIVKKATPDDPARPSIGPSMVGRGINRRTPH
jgi:hypothetical protein